MLFAAIIIGLLFLLQTEPIITPQNAYQLQEMNVIGLGLVADMEYSPNGQTIAVVDSRGISLYNAQAFDTAAYRRLPLSSKALWAESIDFSPDGKWLATVSRTAFKPYDDPNAKNRLIQLWNVETQQPIAEWWYVEGDTAFSPDSKTLAIYNPYASTDAVLWDISQLLPAQLQSATQEAIFSQGYNSEQPIRTADNRCLSIYSPDQTLLATSDVDCNLHITNVGTGQEISVIPNAYADGTIHFSPDNRLLFWEQASEGYDTIHIWDIEQNTEVWKEDSVLTAFAFSLDSSSLLIADASLWIERINTENWTKETVLGYPDDPEHWVRGDHVESMAVSPDGDLVIARANSLEFRNVDTGIRSHTTVVGTSTIHRVIYNSAGSLVAAADSETGVYILDAHTFEERAHLRFDNPALDLAFSPDGALLATANSIPDGTKPTAVLLWSVADILAKSDVTLGDELARIDYVDLVGNADSSRISFSPDGQTLAVTGLGVELWALDDLLQWGTVNRDNPHDALIATLDSAIAPLAFTSDGTILATGMSGKPDCDIALWSVEANTIQQCLDAREGVVASLAFNPANTLLASASNFRQDYNAHTVIQLWDFQSRDKVSVLDNQFEWVWQLAFSPNGQFLVSAHGGHPDEGWNRDGVVHVWGIPEEQR